MLSWWRFIYAIVGLLYGIVKIVVGSIAVFLPVNARNALIKRFPAIRQVVSKDVTISAKVIELALVIFGIYTVCHCLNLLDVINLPLINTRAFLYIFYAAIGIVVTVFYTLVVCTDLPIPKTQEDMFRYKIIGLVGGITFLISAPIMAIIHTVHDHGGVVNAYQQDPFSITMCAASIAALVVIMAFIIHNAVQTKHKNSKITLQDLVSFTLIPAGFM